MHASEDQLHGYETPDSKPYHMKPNHEDCFINPQFEHVQYSVSIKDPQEWQTQPNGRFCAFLSMAARDSAALVRFLKFGLLPVSLNVRLFLPRDALASEVAAAGPETDVGLDGRGRSTAHASQHRKLGGFSSVQIGHVHGCSYALLSDMRSAGSAGGGASDEVVRLLSGTGGGDVIDRGPAGLP